MRQAPHFKHLALINKALSITTIVLALLLHTPLLDPLRLSAAHQNQRLLNEDVAPEMFDFAALQYKLGHIGYAYVQSLHNAQLPLQTEIDEQLKLLAATDNYYQFRDKKNQSQLKREWLTLLPKEQPLPESLWAAIKEQGRDENACNEEQHCVLYAVNLDNDDVLEQVLFIPSNKHYEALELYDNDSKEEWSFIQNLYIDAALSETSANNLALEEALLNQQVSTQAPRYYKDLIIGKYRFYSGQRQ